MSVRHRALPSVLVGLVFGASLGGVAQIRTDVQRTIYLTATDRAGAHVSDLTPADLTIREAGRDRQLLTLQPSTARLRISIAIAERISPDIVVRQGLARFIQLFQGSADIAMYLMGAGNAKLVDHTADAKPLLQVLADLPLRSQGGGNLVESLFELTKAQRNVEGRRAIVVLATEAPEQATVTANGVLDQLRDTGAVLYAATLVGTAAPLQMSPDNMARLETVEEVERDRALNDGTKQSGGLRLPVLRVDDFSKALDRIRAELQHEWVATYVMPAGTKSDGRVSLSSKRRGVTVRGLSQLPKL
jgi:hypothetical protein